MIFFFNSNFQNPDKKKVKKYGHGQLSILSHIGDGEMFLRKQIRQLRDSRLRGHVPGTDNAAILEGLTFGTEKVCLWTRRGPVWLAPRLSRRERIFATERGVGEGEIQRTMLVVIHYSRQKKERLPGVINDLSFDIHVARVGAQVPTAPASANCRHGGRRNSRHRDRALARMIEAAARRCAPTQTSPS